MRRFHNPRFAPESLERKLSPSGVAPIPVAAQIHVPAAEAYTAPRVAPTVIFDHAPTASNRGTSVGASLNAPAPTLPVTPVPPKGPTLPPGDGTPPVSPPSVPGGTPNPSIK